MDSTSGNPTNAPVSGSILICTPIYIWYICRWTQYTYIIICIYVYGLNIGQPNQSAWFRRSYMCSAQTLICMYVYIDTYMNSIRTRTQTHKLCIHIYEQEVMHVWRSRWCACVYIYIYIYIYIRIAYTRAQRHQQSIHVYKQEVVHVWRTDVDMYACIIHVYVHYTHTHMHTYTYQLNENTSLKPSRSGDVFPPPTPFFNFGGGGTSRSTCVRESGDMCLPPCVPLPSHVHCPHTWVQWLTGTLSRGGAEVRKTRQITLKSSHKDLYKIPALLANVCCM